MFGTQGGSCVKFWTSKCARLMAGLCGGPWMLLGFECRLVGRQVSCFIPTKGDDDGARDRKLT